MGSWGMIETLPDWALKEDGILRYDGKLWPQFVKWHHADVHAIYEDTTFTDVDHTE